MKLNRISKMIMIMFASTVMTLALGGVAHAASYDLWVGGEEVTDSNLSGSGNRGGTWTYTPAKAGRNATLTLNNYKYSGEGNRFDKWGSTASAAICNNTSGGGTLYIILVGENTVECVSDALDVHGLYSKDNMTVTGSGSLSVTGKNLNQNDNALAFGIYVTDGDVTLDIRDTTLTAEGKNRSTSAGIEAKYINIRHSKVNVSATQFGGDLLGDANGLQADEINISQGSNVVIRGGNSIEDSWGLKTHSLRVKDSYLEAVGGDIPNVGNYKKTYQMKSFGIAAHKAEWEGHHDSYDPVIIVENSTVKALGGHMNKRNIGDGKINMTAGIYCYLQVGKGQAIDPAMVINGGSVEARGANIDQNDSKSRSYGVVASSGDQDTGASAPEKYGQRGNEVIINDTSCLSASGDTSAFGSEKEQTVYFYEDQHDNFSRLSTASADKEFTAEGWDNYAGTGDPQAFNVEYNDYLSIKDKLAGYKSVRISPIPVTGFTLNKDAITLDYAEQFTLKPTAFTPANASDKTVTWTSSDTNVAKVSSDGLVTGGVMGTAVITATSPGGATATCKVRVKELPVNTVALNRTSQKLECGQTVALKATVSPSNATYKNITWSTGNKKIATVSNDGLVTAVGGGTTTIKATARSGKSATFKITVKEYKDIKRVYVLPGSLSLKVGKAKTLKAVILPKNARNKRVTWTSKNPKIATVTSEGKVTAIKKGTTYITVKTADSKKTKKIKVTVRKK
ncbi:MAG: Ig-like domain-containing protein [Lachnospiraceae bacterium]|nr:Ig-like domain-containing protein [Lachnospiraceae bacterium]